MPIRFSILLFLLTLAGTPTTAQILYQEEGRYFGDEPFFNTDFIRRNNIRSLNGEISTKQEMDRIRTKGLEYYFEFDEKGRMITQYETFRQSDKQKDTTIINYHYNDAGKLALRRRNDVQGFYSYQYDYDDKGRLQKVTYSRETNKGPSRYDFELDQRFVITEETYSYDTLEDGTVKRSYYNSGGRLYKEAFTTRDEYGYLKEQRTRLVVTRRRSRITYEHDAKGRVIRREEDHDLSDTTSKAWAFTYDDVGNLLTADQYVNNTHQTHKEYLYRDTMLLKAELTKDIETKLIKIVEFEVEFYEEQ